jgi:uncharacterized protein (TIGR03437 family)
LSVTVNVSGEGGPGTGQVKLVVDNISVGNLVTLSGGTAVIGIPDVANGVPDPITIGLVPGAHTIGVNYGGDSHYLAQSAGSNQVSLQIGKAQASFTVVVTPNPADPGQSLTVSINATGAAGLVTGQVKLALDNTSVGNLFTLSGGSATIHVPDLANGIPDPLTLGLNPGTHSAGVLYGGSVNYLAQSSTSNQIPLVIRQASQTTLAASANPAVYGQGTSFTATVTPGATGTVTFTIDGVPGSPVAVAGGHASTSTLALAVGPHPISAVYSGDSNFTGSASTTLTESVNQANTSISTPAMSGSAIFGQTQTFSATVSVISPGAGTPTGTVTFFDGSTTLGTGTLNGSGVASVSTASLSAGNHSITAAYSGDANFTSSGLSGPLSATIAKAATTVTLAANPNPAVYGQPISYTATVTSGATGMVNFLENGSPLNATPIAVTAGQAQFSVTSTTGVHSITASYSGDSNFTGSASTTLTETINQANTSISIPAMSGSAIFGQTQTFSATVSAISPGAGTPTGTATFFDGSATLGTGTLNGSGVASVSTASLSAGNHSITAAYSGDANFTSSGPSGPLSATIAKAATTVTLAANPNPAVYGQPISYTATVTSGATGTVNFLENGSPLNATPIAVTAGQAQFSVTGTTGAHSITASYSGDTNYQSSSSGAASVTVNKAATSVSTPTVNGTLTAGQTLTFSAAVTVTAPGAGTPVGTITFREGATLVGTGPVNGNGLASIVTSTLIAGVHNITASYDGDSNFLASTSGSLSITLAQNGNNSLTSTRLFLTSDLNPSAFGQPVTFTAALTYGGNGAAPGGTVQFFDAATLLGTVPVASGQATLRTAALGAGSHAIVAIYGGDSLYAGSQASMGLVVNPLAANLTLTAIPTSIVYGQSVTLTATLAGTPLPTGKVTFRDGSANSADAAVANGTATLTLSGLSVGTHQITALYGGDAQWSAAQATATVLVKPASTLTTISLLAGDGDKLKLKAVVYPIAPGAGVPSGGIQFVDTSNQTVIGAASLDGSAASVQIPAGDRTRPINAVYSGDSNFAGSASLPLMRIINAAADVSNDIAPDEAVSIFNVNVLDADIPASLPLGTTLDGATVQITDSQGVTRPGALYGVFASSDQVNFVVPSDTALGPATLTVTGGNGATLSTLISIDAIAPGIFTASMDGKGVFAGQVVYAHADNSQTVDSSVALQGNSLTPNPIRLGSPSDEVFLVLYGTGLRHRASQQSVHATVNGIAVPALSAAQGQYPGLDQINLQLPNSLAGTGMVEVRITVDGVPANTVSADFQ